MNKYAVARGLIRTTTPVGTGYHHHEPVLINISLSNGVTPIEHNENKVGVSRRQTDIHGPLYKGLRGYISPDLRMKLTAFDLYIPGTSIYRAKPFPPRIPE